MESFISIENDERVRYLISGFIEDQELLNAKFTLYKHQEDRQKHLDRLCQYSSASLVKDTASSQVEKTDFSFTELIASSFMSAHHSSLCDWCYSLWLDALLSEEEQNSLSLGLTHSYNRNYREEKLRRLSLESLRFSGDALEELLEVITLILDERRRLIACSQSENRVSKAVRREMNFSDELYVLTQDLVRGVIGEIEQSEIAEDLRFSKALSKELFKDEDLGFLLKEDLDLKTLNELLKEDWLECTDQSSDERRKVLIDRLIQLLDSNKIGKRTKQNWTGMLNRLVLTRTKEWEEELMKAQSRSEVLFLLDKGNYASKQLAELTALFEVSYKAYSYEDRYAYIIPNLWRERLNKLIDDASRGYYHPKSDLGNYACVLDNDLTKDETETLLRLWTPESQSIFSNPKEAYKATKRL